MSERKATTSVVRLPAGGRPAEAYGAAAPPNREAMARAVQAFLDAAGLDRADAELSRTAERVAAAWADELIDGYREDPDEALGRGIPCEPGGGPVPVTVTDIEFVSICPHHLLPYRGMAHVAFVPRERIVGFSRIVRLVDCLAHRLVLQEVLTWRIAEVLHHRLEALGAACVTVAEQSCMSMRGVRRSSARTACRAGTGQFEAEPDLWARVGLP